MRANFPSMIQVRENMRLKQILHEPDRFPVGVELVSTRGTMSEAQCQHTRSFSEALTYSPEVDWVSITDNAGGNPQLAPMALGTPILYAGKEVVIHLTCKDLNRHALESQLWMYASQGFHNVLAMTGDYPVTGPEGLAKPVFDTDSTGLLHIIERMNEGLEVRPSRRATQPKRLAVTNFYSGAVCNPFKTTENTLMPQYYKLLQKLRHGAQYIIPQIGYDARQSSELLAFMCQQGFANTPVIGNVYVLNRTVARLFHDNKIPGVTVTDGLLSICDEQAQSADRGKTFFLELAAKQVAVFKGLGYRGAYLGGVHRYEDVQRILEIHRSFARDDWKSFLGEFQHADPDAYRLFEADPDTGLVPVDDAKPAPASPRPRREVAYRLAQFVHQTAFENGRGLAPLGKRLCQGGKDRTACPGWLRLLERGSKSLLYDCKDCGDCSLAETAFLCPMSQCPKNQRNGPCGGSCGQRCEVRDQPCIWSRAYDRRASEGDPASMLEYTPVFQDQSLRDTSAWANYWHQRDHQGKPIRTEPSITKETP